MAHISHGVGMVLRNNGNDGHIQVDEDPEGNIEVTIHAENISADRIEIIWK